MKIDGLERRFLAAIDATGRAAAWSRPVRRQQRHVAELFEGPPCPSSLRGRVVADRGGKRCAYRVGLPGSTSVGIIRSGQSRSELDPSIAQSLDLPAGQFYYVGRRPAFPQWAIEPACGRRFAVGDAAFASDPLAGQGIRFAMASGIAAAAAVHSLAQSAWATLAVDYYRNFVGSARDRHLAWLARLREGLSAPPPPFALPDTLRFTARPRLAALERARHACRRPGVRAPRRRSRALGRRVRPPQSRPPHPRPRPHVRAAAKTSFRGFISTRCAYPSRLVRRAQHSRLIDRFRPDKPARDHTAPRRTQLPSSRSPHDRQTRTSIN